MSRVKDDEPEHKTAAAPAPRQVYVRRQCRQCRVIAGGFTEENDFRRRRCQALVKQGDATVQCNGDMEEIWR